MFGSRPLASAPVAGVLTGIKATTAAIVVSFSLDAERIGLRPIEATAIAASVAQATVVSSRGGSSLIGASIGFSVVAEAVETYLVEVSWAEVAIAPGITTLPRYYHPVADLTQNWKTQGGASTDLFSTLDEAEPDDTDYVRSPIVSRLTTSQQSFALPSIPVPPSGYQQSLSYRIALDGNVAQRLTVRLLQGTTTIATWTETVSSPEPYTVRRVLNEEQIASITDYQTLRLEFEAGGA